MNFLDWAPEKLCAWYREHKVYWDMLSAMTSKAKGVITLTDLQEKALLERLLTHPDMKRAWRELKNASQSGWRNRLARMFSSWCSMRSLKQTVKPKLGKKKHIAFRRSLGLRATVREP